jgi:acetolactate decarboxylase
MSSPFATVTQFKPAKFDIPDKPMNYAELQKHLDGLIGSKKKVYAFKITGDFESVKTRSIPKQVKPYPPIMEAGKSQKISEFKNTDGVMSWFSVNWRIPIFI